MTTMADTIRRLEDAVVRRPGFGVGTNRSRTTIGDGVRCVSVEGEWSIDTDLPPALGASQPVADSGSGTVLVLDGRLGHSVPTVVLLGADFVRWGAGATWDGAVRRALYGDDGNPSVDAELVAMTEMLGTRGLGVVAVDLDTPLLRRVGIVRTSVQLIAANVLGR